MSAKKNPPLVISDEHHEIRIYTVKGRTGSFHQLSYYEAGQRKRRTFADLNEAKREARLLLSQMAGERLQAKTLSALDMESFTLATKRLEATGVPLHVGAELFAEAHRVLKGHSVVEAAKYYMQHFDPMRPRKPLRELIAEFQQSRRAMGVSARHLESLQWGLGRFEAAFGGSALDDLDAARLDEWLQGHPGWKNRSRNCCRVILVSFGNFLKKRGYLPAGAPSVFDRMSALKNELSAVTLYTAQEMRRLLGRASVTLVPYLAIGAFAGLRSAEIARLDWSRIRFERGFIECEAGMTKTRRRRLVPIQDNLRAWLEPIALPSGRVVAHTSLSSALCFFGAKSGIPWKRNALRHSYISHRLALVPDTARVALECGNSPDVIFQHYRELVTPDEAQEWFNVMPPEGYPQCFSTRGPKPAKTH